MKIKIIAIALLVASFLNAQQAADTTFLPSNKVMTFYERNKPIVLIDEAHNNFHTMAGRYQAFAKVLESDGFIVKPNTTLFNLDSLKNANVLVISNALNQKNLENWDLPNYSAFTRQEIETVYHWVKDGGSLLLIADHMPFPAAAADLAAIFGFQFNNGFAIDTTNQRQTIFKKSDNTLVNHPILEGTSSSERVDSVRTFTGQAFLVPFNAKPILKHNRNTVSYMPAQVWQFDENTPQISVEKWCQGATLEFYKGRIAVFGEAAMFTAQYNQENNIWFGLRASGAEQNEQFLLNTMHWLSNVF
jgi:hypothetical protein